MKLKISPNRMNLLKLRKRLKFALRGHKLLKDKQEQLTKEFNSLIVQLTDIRKSLETELSIIYKYLKKVLANKSYKILEHYFDMLSKNLKFEVKLSRESRFNIKYDKYTQVSNNIQPKILTTDPDLNFVMIKLIKLYDLIIKLTNLETLCELLSGELQTTRRRVNGLEYVIIPQIKDGIRFIITKLNEFERTSITQLMRIKQLME